ncbi:MAG: site-specific integrase [Armatimonadetes bacterium]|nr:site-specific integrase [Armatimonadota bacterium]
MPKQPKRYYLYARKRAGQAPIWYVRFRDEHGAIGSPLCTEEADHARAERWAVERLLNGTRTPARKPKAKTFGEWAAPWWIHASCPYIREKIAGGFSISQKYAAVRRSYLTRHLLPAFEDRSLSSLTPTDFRDMKMRLLGEGELSPSTINRILGTARVMFGYAVLMGELENNPVAPVKELKETPAVRGILSLEELRHLFAPGALLAIWNNDPRHLTVNLLAASTGMRLGECQALQVQHVHDDYIDVRHSWDDKYGRSAPKWGSARLIPIPSRTAAALDDLLAVHRWGEPRSTDVVFWGKDRDTPLSKTSLLDGFKSALARAGIPEEERKRRVLLFHGYRHLFNTFIRGKVPDEQLRRVTGHRTLAMSDNYDHAAIEHLADVKAAQEKMFVEK